MVANLFQKENPYFETRYILKRHIEIKSISTNPYKYFPILLTKALILVAIWSVYMLLF